MLLKVSYAKHFLSLPLNVKLFRRGVKSAHGGFLREIDWWILKTQWIMDDLARIPECACLNVRASCP